MFRYLTPAKIGLLALIQLYVQDCVSAEATVPVLDFLTFHLLNDEHKREITSSAGRWRELDKTVQILTSINAFEQVLGALAAVDGLPGRRLWDQFLDKVWGINSLHTLYEFFDGVLQLLALSKDDLRELEERGEDLPTGIRLHHNSCLGLFVRRAHHEFSRLPFHDTTALWKALIKYRDSTKEYYQRRNPQHGRFSFDHVLLEGQHDWGENTDTLGKKLYGDVKHDSTLAVSVEDIEGVLEFQIGRLQKYGIRVPQEVTARIKKLRDDSLIIPTLSHYLRFLDAWKSGDYQNAYSFLHRYFDYSTQVRDRNFYQYALMNLAILHADFGCNKEAVDAMLGTITTARENGDMTCLNFALNWLFHFGRAHPTFVEAIRASHMLGRGRESLTFLRANAKESGMWVLCSSSLLSEAKLGLSNGESLADCVEYMVRSSQLILENNTRIMFGAQLSLYMSLWDRLGLTGLSSMICEVYLRCHAEHGIFEDQMKMICRLAGQLATKGHYNAAFAKLDAIDPEMLRNWKSNQYCVKYRGLIKLRRDLHHGDLDVADILLHQLLQTKADDLEPDLAFVIDMMRVEALIRRGDLDAAGTEVEALLSSSHAEDKDVALRVRLMLLKCDILDLAGRPQRGFTLAVRAVNLAWRARLLRLLWQAVGALANVLSSLREFAAAEALLLAVLPRSLECEGVFLNGMLYSLLADARMGLAGRADETTGTTVASGAPDATMTKARKNKRVGYLKKAHEALECALVQFAAVEDDEKQCDILAKMATVMRLMGERQIAGDYTAKLLHLNTHAITRRKS